MVQASRYIFEGKKMDTLISFARTKNSRNWGKVHVDAVIYLQGAADSRLYHQGQGSWGKDISSCLSVQGFGKRFWGLLVAKLLLAKEVGSTALLIETDCLEAPEVMNNSVCVYICNMPFKYTYIHTHTYVYIFIVICELCINYSYYLVVFWTTFSYGEIFNTTHITHLKTKKKLCWDFLKLRLFYSLGLFVGSLFHMMHIREK